MHFLGFHEGFNYSGAINGLAALRDDFPGQFEDQQIPVRVWTRFGAPG